MKYDRPDPPTVGPTGSPVVARELTSSREIVWWSDGPSRRAAPEKYQPDFEHTVTVHCEDGCKGEAIWRGDHWFWTSCTS